MKGKLYWKRVEQDKSKTLLRLDGPAGAPPA